MRFPQQQEAINVARLAAVSSIASPSWSPAANDLMPVWVVARSTASEFVDVASVTGNGATFEEVVTRRASADHQNMASLWQANESSYSAGAITATLDVAGGDGNANSAVTHIARISPPAKVTRPSSRPPTTARPTA